MKKIITLSMFATILFYANQVNAKILRVGYSGTPVAKTDYADLQSAHDSASIGDTILLFPGYYTAAFSKKLSVLGYGYFVTGTGANAGLQNITAALAVNITLDSASAGTVLEGIDGLTVNTSYGQSTKNITIRRCNVQVYLYYGSSYDNWQILQCYIGQIYGGYNSNLITNLSVNNCIITSLNLYGLANSSNGQFNNDIIFGGSGYEFGNGAFIIQNCILLSGHGLDANCEYLNSIANSSYVNIPSGNGNQNITNDSLTNNVFVGYYNQGTFSNDGRWVLQTNSAAKAAGTNGTDCGIFGGNNPYKLSGIPRIPSFYKLSATGSTGSTNPYTITFSVRSNN